MSRRANVLILCEDKQQATFARRFLEGMGWIKQRIRVLPFAEGRGSGEQRVREKFPKELLAHRSKLGSVDQVLIVIQDGDEKGVPGRLAALDRACSEAAVRPRQAGERVAILVPTWRIETWLAYLDGQSVDEGKRDYPKLARESDCGRHVGELVRMCQEGQLREPAPASLATACDEFRVRIRETAP